MSARSEAVAAAIDQRCDLTTWQTPEWVLEAVRQAYGGPIGLDPASSADNPTQAVTWLTADDDGLSVGWAPWLETQRLRGLPDYFFCNPPYGGVNLQAWIPKIGQEAARGARGCALLNNVGLETAYRQRWLFTPDLDALVLFRGRLAFRDPRTGKAAPNNRHGSILYAFGCAPSRLRRAFGDRALVVGVSLAAHDDA